MGAISNSVIAQSRLRCRRHRKYARKDLELDHVACSSRCLEASVGDTTLEWYGKAVEALQKRPITDITSWWSFGAMHGIDKGIWKGFGFIADDTKFPPSGVQKKLWGQCQHLSWYFCRGTRLSCCF